MNQKTEDLLWRILRRIQEGGNIYQDSGRMEAYKLLSSLLLEALE